MTAEDDKGQGAPEEPQAPERPGETFKHGLSLLWRAARTAADEIKREVDRGSVTDALRNAGRDLEVAASEAARALEGFIERIGPRDPETSEWPSAGADEEPKEQPAPTVDADVPREGATDEKGEPRNMRIQADDD